MLITRRFVLLNFPKTGSSFVRAVIKAIHRRRRWRLRREAYLKELMLPRGGGDYPGVDQHGGVSQVPERWRHLPLVSVIRSPWERLLSAFEFPFWQHTPPVPRAEAMALLPHFPDIGLDDFVTLWDRAAEHRLGGANPRELGHQTVQFVKFFFRDPPRALARLSDDYVDSGAFRADMADISLLRHERLRDDLAEFLARHDYASDELALARGHARVNETPRGPGSRDALWTPRAAHYVAWNERYLLRMLAGLGLHYFPPQSAGQALVSSETLAAAGSAS